ncbi:hypothetical protein [Bacillus swezeyi]|uniref:hypothetical protein n=1 Tax=Bacillus swezeyi TaxID=1925020 RepID=UPI001237A6D9|nr:hypothetical protein [Bacillus swezeyi]
MIKRAFPSCWAINDHHTVRRYWRTEGSQSRRPGEAGYTRELHGAGSSLISFSFLHCGAAGRQAGRPESDFQQLGSQTFQTPRTGCTSAHPNPPRSFLKEITFLSESHASSAKQDFPLAFACPLTASSLQRSPAPRLDPDL